MLIGNLDNILKMNLQLLAGEGEEGNEEDPGDNGSDGGGEEVKTYTQEELDALLNDAKKDLPSDEELIRFKEWQENQKTEAQKKDEKLEAETTTKSGIVLSGSAKEKPQEAEVMAVGPGAIHEGKRIDMEVKVGDKVLYSKYAGTEVKVGGEEYTILKQDDILAIVE